jgi:leader peptidase (prepilin peptidase)/N-methyltransferase
MLVYYWLIVVFVIGATVGSFLNVVVARLPFEKSLFWPSSRCGKCHEPIRWYDNLPLISYLWLRGRCRACGQPYSIRYFFVELVTALGFAGLYWLELVLNVHDWPTRGHVWAIGIGQYPWSWWIGYIWHALLFSLLLAASVCDLQTREIPLGITLFGTLIGLVGAILMPWPWPWTPAEATPAVPAGLPQGMAWMAGHIQQGIYAWPPCGPLPGWLAPGGNWQTGLVTGLAGALVGAFLIRAIGFVFSMALGKEAIGLGDADLMMMAGAFLGWQLVVAGFFMSIVPGLFFGIFQLLFRRDNSLPFGPSLAAGVMLTCVGWKWIGAYLQLLFFWGTLMLILAGAMLVFLVIAGLGMRMVRG